MRIGNYCNGCGKSFVPGDSKIRWQLYRLHSEDCRQLLIKRNPKLGNVIPLVRPEDKKIVSCSCYSCLAGKPHGYFKEAVQVKKAVGRQKKQVDIRHRGAVVKDKKQPLKQAHKPTQKIPAEPDINSKFKDLLHEALIKVGLKEQKVILDLNRKKKQLIAIINLE